MYKANNENITFLVLRTTMVATKGIMCVVIARFSVHKHQFVSSNL